MEKDILVDVLDALTEPLLASRKGLICEICHKYEFSCSTTGNLLPNSTIVSLELFNFFIKHENVLSIFGYTLEYDNTSMYVYFLSRSGIGLSVTIRK